MLVRGNSGKSETDEHSGLSARGASTFDRYAEHLDIEKSLATLAQQITEHQNQRASLQVQLEMVGEETRLANEHLVKCQLAVESCDLFSKDKELEKELTSANFHHAALFQQINQIDLQFMSLDITVMGGVIDDAYASEKQKLTEQKNKLAQDLDAANNMVRRLITARHDILVRDQEIAKSLRGFVYSKKSRNDALVVLKEAEVALQQKNGEQEKLKAEESELDAVIHDKTAQGHNLQKRLDEQNQLSRAEIIKVGNANDMEEVEISDTNKQASQCLTILEEKLSNLLAHYRQLENPSLEIDLCMIELNGLLEHIAECRRELSEVSVDILRRMTQQLLGFVHHSLNKYATDKSLLKCLRDAMSGIDQQEDVGRMIEDYLRLCVSSVNIPSQVAGDAEVVRQKRYENFCQQLYDVSSNFSGHNITKEEKRFNTAGQHLIKTLNKATSIDIGYRIEVVIAARNLRVKPSHDNQAILSELIDRNIDGKASEVMEVTGSVMMIIGAAIIATSIFMAFLSLGFAAPLVIAGLALGGVVFASGSALVVGSGPNRTEKALRNFQDTSVGFFQGGRCSPNVSRSAVRVIDAGRTKVI